MGLPQHIGVQAAVEIWASLGELATNKAKVNASVLSCCRPHLAKKKNCMDLERDHIGK